VRSWERPVPEPGDVGSPNDLGLAVAVLDNHDPVLVVDALVNYARRVSASPAPAPAWTNFPLPGVVSRRRRPAENGDRSGTVLGGQWELRKRLGAGGMGEVYKAASCLDRLPYALKLLFAKHGRGSTIRRRFEHEFCVLRRVDHPHIVKAHAFQETDSECFYAMDLIQGPTLSALIAPDEPPLDVLRVLRLAMQLCDALRHLHALGVVHRDLKPDNIIVQQLDGRDHAWLVDFGVCKLLPAWYSDLEMRTEPGLRLHTDTGALVGTRGYVAPSKAEEEQDKLRDVFGLGATLFRCLTGRLPYPSARQEGAEVKWNARDDRIPNALKYALEFALAIDPAKRCPSIEMLETRLRVALEDLEPDEADEDGAPENGARSAHPSSTAGGGPPKSGSWRNVPVLAAGAGLVLVGWFAGVSQAPTFSASRTAIAWASRLPSITSTAAPTEIPVPRFEDPPGPTDVPPETGRDESATLSTTPVQPQPQQDPVRTSRRGELSAAAGDLGRCLPSGESAAIKVEVGSDGTVRDVSVVAPNLPSVALRCLERRLDRISFQPGKTTQHQLKL